MVTIILYTNENKNLDYEWVDKIFFQNLIHAHDLWPTLFQDRKSEEEEENYFKEEEETKKETHKFPEDSPLLQTDIEEKTIT